MNNNDKSFLIHPVYSEPGMQYNIFAKK